VGFLQEEGINIWEQSFTKKPHSNKKLSQFLPLAIEAAAHLKPAWNDPSSFPQPVRAWWEGQRQILFHAVKVSGLKDIILVLDRCQRLRPDRTEHVDASSLQHVLRQLMQIQQEDLQQGKGHLRNVGT
jgi:hypothetical protein